MTEGQVDRAARLALKAGRGQRLRDDLEQALRRHDLGLWPFGLEQQLLDAADRYDGVVRRSEDDQEDLATAEPKESP